MPLQLHHDSPVIWAHRGGRSLAAENTLLALKRAYSAGAHGWETDVVLTRDGVPILLHDLNLLRTTNAICHSLFRDNPPALPWRFTLDEIKTLNAGIFPRRACGTPVTERMLKEGPIGPASDDMAVPTLAEGLRLSATLGLWVNIEIKDVSRAMTGPLTETIVSKVLSIVLEEGMSDRVVISSFNHDYLVQSKNIAPDIPTAALTRHDFKGDPVELTRAIGAQAWHPGYKKLTRTAVQHARASGCAVNPFTVNDSQIMQQLLDWGVSGIVTDRPQDMYSLLDKQKDIDVNIRSHCGRMDSGFDINSMQQCGGDG